MKLCDILKEATVMVPLKSISRDEAIQELLSQLEKLGYLSATVKLIAGIEELEINQCTAVGRGVAYPHATSIEIDNLVSILGISYKGIDYNAPDGQLCHLILLTLSPIEEPDEHRKFTSLFRKMISQPDIRSNLLESNNSSEVIDIINNWEEFEKSNEDFD